MEYELKYLLFVIVIAVLFFPSLIWLQIDMSEKDDKDS